MKKAFVVSSLALWILGLLIGIGFAAMEQATGANKLPLENRQLLTESRSLAKERDLLLATIEFERDRAGQYLAVIGLQNDIIVESVTHPPVTYFGTWPNEE